MRTLDDDVLAVFERACREQDWQVAEHLLQALETLARRNDSEARLHCVYVELAHFLRDGSTH